MGLPANASEVAAMVAAASPQEQLGAHTSLALALRWLWLWLWLSHARCFSLCLQFWRVGVFHLLLQS